MLFIILILLWVYRRSLTRFFFGMTRPWMGYGYRHRPPMGGWYGAGPGRGFGPHGFGRF